MWWKKAQEDNISDMAAEQQAAQDAASEAAASAEQNLTETKDERKIREAQEAKEQQEKEMQAQINHWQWQERMKVENERYLVLGPISIKRKKDTLSKNITEMGITDFQIETTTNVPQYHVIIFREEDFNLYKLTVKDDKNVMVHHMDEHGKITN